ncbi:tyrosine-protein phosphatase [uncultured Sharpea sp.]|uniref:tyrosine-protein phosphatase n=1 Tax=uncultured Sharpea sp. TaxID=1112738 RepID=UPI0025858447|nr:CpsB/CapC family capsule biosynthesis tyrosine phosphatase [uncultured Sharpea sp.]
MIDIHSHVLPLVDDGSSSIEMSLKMLQQAYQDGTDAIVLTPHLAYPYRFINPKEKIESLFKDFQRIVDDEHIPIKMYLGCEFLFTKDDFENHFHEIRTLNNSQYMLMEFYCYIPIIAHPERYEAIQIDEDVAFKAKEMGAYLQMNKASILGRHGTRAQECIYRMLENHLISFVGSDAHNVTTRNTFMYKSYQEVSYYFGRDYANAIFKNNAKNILGIEG